MGDDLEVRVPLEEAGEDEPGHGDAGLVRPAQRPPDLVLRGVLGGVVGEARAAGGVHPDGQVPPGHLVEHRAERRVVQRPPADVGEHLHAAGAEVVDRGGQLVERRVRVVHGQGGDERGEPVGVLIAQLAHRLVGKARQRR
jgi:hypothetical protein